MASDNPVFRYSDGLMDEVLADPRLNSLSVDERRALGKNMIFIIDTLFGGVPSPDADPKADSEQDIAVGISAITVQAIINRVFDSVSETGKIPKPEEMGRMIARSIMDLRRQEIDNVRKEVELLERMEARISEEVNGRIADGDRRLKRLGSENIRLLIKNLAKICAGIFGNRLNDAAGTSARDMIGDSMKYQFIVHTVLDETKRAGRVLSYRDMLEIAGERGVEPSAKEKDGPGLESKDAPRPSDVPRSAGRSLTRARVWLSMGRDSITQGEHKGKNPV